MSLDCQNLDSTPNEVNYHLECIFGLVLNFEMYFYIERP